MRSRRDRISSRALWFAGVLAGIVALFLGNWVRSRFFVVRDPPFDYLSYNWISWGFIYGMALAAATLAWSVARREWDRCEEGHCAKCGYPLKGLPEPRCPECGTPFDPGPSSEMEE